MSHAWPGPWVTVVSVFPKRMTESGETLSLGRRVGTYGLYDGQWVVRLLGMQGPKITSLGNEHVYCFSSVVLRW